MRQPSKAYSTAAVTPATPSLVRSKPPSGSRISKRTTSPVLIAGQSSGMIGERCAVARASPTNMSPPKRRWNPRAKRSTASAVQHRQPRGSVQNNRMCLSGYVTADLSRLVEAAAIVRGQSKSAFVVDAAIAEAQMVLREFNRRVSDGSAPKSLRLTVERLLRQD